MTLGYRLAIKAPFHESMSSLFLTKSLVMELMTFQISIDFSLLSANLQAKSIN